MFDGCLGAGVSFCDLLSVWFEIVWETTSKTGLPFLYLSGRNMVFWGCIKEREPPPVPFSEFNYSKCTWHILG